jgi:GNAT superfamily N-acetyltransferase
VTEAPDALATALRFLRLTQCAVAEQVTAVPVGSVLRSDRLPAALQANCVIVHEPVRRPEGTELIALADLMHGHLAQRRVVVEDEALAVELAESFQLAGWLVERQVVMALHERPAEPGPAAGAPAIGPLSAQEAQEIEARIDREAMDQLGLTDERLLEDQLAYLEAMRAARRGRCFGRAGASTCTLLSDGATVQIEEVGTVPEARGRGLARATVQAAIDAAAGEGRALTFLIADADDWPQAFYARLGFEPVGTRHVCSRYEAPVT